MSSLTDVYLVWFYHWFEKSVKKLPAVCGTESLGFSTLGYPVRLFLILCLNLESCTYCLIPGGMLRYREFVMLIHKVSIKGFILLEWMTSLWTGHLRPALSVSCGLAPSPPFIINVVRAPAAEAAEAPVHCLQERRWTCMVHNIWLDSASPSREVEPREGPVKCIISVLHALCVENHIAFVGFYYPHPTPKKTKA